MTLINNEKDKTNPHLNRLSAWMAPEHRWKAKLLAAWKDLPFNWNKQVVLQKLDGCTVRLQIQNPCLAQELTMFKPQILATLNQYLDQPRLTQLHFTTVTNKNISSNYQMYNSRQITKASPSPLLAIDNNLSIWAVTLSYTEAKALAKVHSQTLQQALHQFWLRCKKLEVKREEQRLLGQNPLLLGLANNSKPTT